MNKQSAGGRATAIILKKKALDRYYSNPNLCKKCGKVIQVENGKKVSEVRKRVYCSYECAGLTRHRFPKKEPRYCPSCGTVISKQARRCRKCIPQKEWVTAQKTKEEMFSKRKNWQSARSQIRKHAEHVFYKKNPEPKCSKCGYDKHIEVCHIKAVSSYPNTALIKEINAIENLIGLCPNCHWEFDNQ